MRMKKLTIWTLIEIVFAQKPPVLIHSHTFLPTFLHCISSSKFNDGMKMAETDVIMLMIARLMYILFNFSSTLTSLVKYAS